MTRSLARALTLALVLLWLSSGVARAAQTVRVEVSEGDYLVLNGHRYRGPLEVGVDDDGLLVVETTTLDGYLEGIREVPFSWDPEALKAQAVAARTYLASSLGQGDFDICATSACQVYAGVDALLGPDGDRWRSAVEETRDQILTLDGEPIRAYYSSTTGGHTRNIEDIWPGSDPAPYLVGVPSPGEDSPFVNWSWELPAYQMERLLAVAGLVDGGLISISTNTTHDGEGPWTVRIVSDRQDVEMDTWDLRGKLNAAASVMPDRLPAQGPGGRRYPTTILSPEFQIRRVVRIGNFAGDAFPDPYYVVEGHGWGHLIGMSQYGAQAMARRGSTYDEILAHYYGGILPTDGASILPRQVRVGLVVGAPSVLLGGTGPIVVTADGEPVSGEPFGLWRLRATEGGVIVLPPDFARPGIGERFWPS